MVDRKGIARITDCRLGITLMHGYTKQKFKHKGHEGLIIKGTKSTKGNT
jgi:hypothetical protein